MMETTMEFPQRGTRVEIEEGKQFMPNFDPSFDDGGLIPCITQNWQTHEVLMLGWMNREALATTLETGLAHYYSRARQRLWKKGEQSGQAQIVKRMLIDDDQDCLLIEVELTGGASCHVGYRSCFFRALEWQPGETNFSLDFLEMKKIYNPQTAYGGTDHE